MISLPLILAAALASPEPQDAVYVAPADTVVGALDRRLTVPLGLVFTAADQTWQFKVTFTHAAAGAAGFEFQGAFDQAVVSFGWVKPLGGTALRGFFLVPQLIGSFTSISTLPPSSESAAVPGGMGARGMVGIEIGYHRTFGPVLLGASLGVAAGLRVGLVPQQLAPLVPILDSNGVSVGVDLNLFRVGFAW